MNQAVDTQHDVERDLLDALQPDSFAADQPEAWQPRTIDEVDWCAQKAAEADAEFQQAVAAARRQQEKISAWLDDAKSRRDDRVSFFEMHAINYLQQVRQSELDKGVAESKLTKTIKLPGGAQLKARQLPDKFNVADEAAAIAWSRSNEAGHLVRVKESISKTDLARHVKATGELPNGVELEPGEVKLSLTLIESAS